jgi:hypothetical protein
MRPSATAAAIHAAQEQIVRSTQQSVVIPLTQPCFQEPPERNGVDQKLKIVTMARHAIAHCVDAVVQSPGAEEVGFVVQYEIPTVVAKDQIDEPAQQPHEIRVLERRAVVPVLVE